jgi:quinol monooxygenase YgiN
MIHATVTVIAPPGQRERVLEALRSLLSPTRVEPGCLSCRLCEDVEVLGSFTLVEDWATPADFVRRLRSDPYRRLLIIMEHSAEPPEVQFRVVCEVLGIEAVHVARGR